MKTAPFQIGRRVAWTVGAVLLFAAQAAQACPGCKQTEGAPLHGDSIGFGLSIFFMLFMIVSVLSGLGWMMYRSCRVLAARDALVNAELEAEEQAAPTSRAADVAPAPEAWAGGLAHGHA
ncbi:MAG: hypothetical protein INR62_11270 [Rhodospirillales bacterium]|nr:hypothetical protein [Acetobacter sp.]